MLEEEERKIVPSKFYPKGEIMVDRNASSWDALPNEAEEVF